MLNSNPRRGWIPFGRKVSDIRHLNYGLTFTRSAGNPQDHNTQKRCYRGGTIGRGDTDRPRYLGGYEFCRRSEGIDVIVVDRGLLSPLGTFLNRELQVQAWSCAVADVGTWIVLSMHAELVHRAPCTESLHRLRTVSVIRALEKRYSLLDRGSTSRSGICNRCGVTYSAVQPQS